MICHPRVLDSLWVTVAAAITRMTFRLFRNALYRRLFLVLRWVSSGLFRFFRSTTRGRPTKTTAATASPRTTATGIQRLIPTIILAADYKLVEQKKELTTTTGNRRTRDKVLDERATSCDRTRPTAAVTPGTSDPAGLVTASVCRSRRMKMTKTQVNDENSRRVWFIDWCQFISRPIKSKII